MTIVWLIVRPGYGEFDGMPEYIMRSRDEARRLHRRLNDPWLHLPSRRRPFRIRKLAITEEP